MRRSSWSVAAEVVGSALVEVGRSGPVVSCVLSCE